ncbi:MAG: putative oxygenase MesX [Synechococcaceae cyanobacterium]
MTNDISFSVKLTPYNSQYVAGENTRATTNFANFARHPSLNQQRISLFLDLVNSNLNRILGQPGDDQRFAIRLEILSLYGHIMQPLSAGGILFTEVMRAGVLDQHSGQLLPGPTGLNFSSYLRDDDFRVVLPQLLSSHATAEQMASFGRVHGMLSHLQFGAAGVIPDPLAIAISIAQNHRYRATDHQHPILGREYKAEASSLTDQYFAQMGLQAQFFRPSGLPAPLAFYCGMVLTEASDTYLAALIAVMANFQRIYRPEIYLSRRGFSEQPGVSSQASLGNQDYETPALRYDRQERDQLADQQAKLIENCFIKPYATLVNQLATATSD